jgi:hypothetical protein
MSRSEIDALPIGSLLHQPKYWGLMVVTANNSEDIGVIQKQLPEGFLASLHPSTPPGIPSAQAGPGSAPRLSAERGRVMKESAFNDLATGTAYPFSGWPNPEVPKFAAGVYTIWHNDGRFIYTGMSGRKMTVDTVPRETAQGLFTRLETHWIGRRSVLPTLSQEDITAIAEGHHHMDAFIRRYIHENLSYRFVILPDGKVALAVETAIKNGEWEHGRPLLNPGK